MHILDNEVAETDAPGAQALAIEISNAPGAVVQGNVIANAALGHSDSVGIFVSPTCPQASVVGNHVANLRKGLYLLSSVLYKDNTVGGAVTAFTGGHRRGGDELQLLVRLTVRCCSMRNSASRSASRRRGEVRRATSASVRDGAAP